MLGPNVIIDLTEETNMAVDDQSVVPIIDLTGSNEMEEDDGTVIFCEEHNELAPPTTPETMGAACMPPPLVRQQHVATVEDRSIADDAEYVRKYRQWCQDYEGAFMWELSGVATTCVKCVQEFEELTENIIQFLSLQGEDARIVDYLRELVEKATRIAWGVEEIRKLHDAVARDISNGPPAGDLEASIDTLRLRTVCGAKLFECILQTRCLFERAHEVDLFGTVPEWDDELVAIEMKLNE